MSHVFAHGSLNQNRQVSPLPPIEAMTHAGNGLRICAFCFRCISLCHCSAEKGERPKQVILWVECTTWKHSNFYWHFTSSEPRKMKVRCPALNSLLHSKLNWLPDVVEFCQSAQWIPVKNVATSWNQGSACTSNTQHQGGSSNWFDHKLRPSNVIELVHVQQVLRVLQFHIDAK